MAIKIKSTKTSINSVKALIYGESGVGKTRLASTIDSPLILNAEGGLLSLSQHNIDSIDIETPKDVMDAYEFITESEDAKKYKTIVFDSISEVAEVYLSALKKKHKDPRAAYGELADDISHLIRSFRDIQDKHVYFIAKGQKIEDENGVSIYRPIMPGKTLLNGLPYHFDLVMALRIGKTEEGKEFRYLQTNAEMQWIAKDRSGLLLDKEKPDLGYIFDKIIKGSKSETKLNTKEEK